MPIDIYSTRAQLAAIELMPREYSFLAETFAADMGAVEDDRAIYDFKKGALQMAPFVRENVGGVLMERGGYETREIGFCTIAPKRLVDLSDTKKRAFGEDILGAMTPEQRSRKILANDLVEMRKAIQRRREWMVRQLLLNGKVEIFEYSTEGRSLLKNKVADYGFTNNYTPSTAWDQSTAKIDEDMREMFDLLYEGLGVAEVIVMAPNVASAMITNTNYIKQFDMRHVDMGEINTKYRGQGVRFLGWNSDGVEMYSFAGKFIDDDGVLKPIIPAGKLIMGGKGIIKMPHGPVTQVEVGGPQGEHRTYIKKEVPLRYADVASNSVTNQITSRPTVVPFNVDAWVVGHVL